ncbi:hypothetical protein SEUCBS139899_002536 [Sporothrix eucalyptigena]|uniref:Uncharacterized protein n=1 Tax=Sporothrix eucalyptigena TaxID=1812306 RepID=A0ABP0B3N2_9PEZI
MDASQNQQAAASGAANNAAGAAGQKEDYGDKAFDFIAKKTGHNVDRNTSEKITDGARTAFEKLTGKKVDPKYSN